MFVHSAKSGELQGGRLTLRGVGRKVTWVTNGGRSGVVSVARLHRRLFLPGTPPATGTLHVAGRRPGREVALRLSRPRYNAPRQTVSYGVKRLSKRPAPSRVGSASQRPLPPEFGPASLSIIGAPPVLGSTDGGHACATAIANGTDTNYPGPGGYGLQAIYSANWPTDTWYQNITPGYVLEATLATRWESDGGLFRGCWATAVWKLVPNPNDPTPAPTPDATFTITTTYPWTASSPTSTCTSSNPQFVCANRGFLPNAGNFLYWIGPA
jgi:hypothetical protein